jgi:hypothetical protein
VRRAEALVRREYVEGAWLLIITAKSIYFVTSTPPHHHNHPLLLIRLMTKSLQ